MFRNCRNRRQRFEVFCINISESFSTELSFYSIFLQGFPKNSIQVLIKNFWIWQKRFCENVRNILSCLITQGLFGHMLSSGIILLQHTLIQIICGIFVVAAVTVFFLIKNQLSHLP